MKLRGTRSKSWGATLLSRCVRQMPSTGQQQQLPILEITLSLTPSTGTYSHSRANKGPVPGFELFRRGQTKWGP